MFRTCEDPRNNQQTPIPSIIRTADITERKSIQACLASARRQTGDRQQGDPGYQPYRSEGLDHHPQIAYEEIGVYAIDLHDLTIVCLEESRDPGNNIADGSSLLDFGIE